MALRSFTDIITDTAALKGGMDAINARLITPKTPDEIRKIPSDRWLSAMTMCVFQAGFSWKVIENKWPNFETAYDGFDIGRWSMMHDEDIDRLMATDGLVAHAPKIKAVGPNAHFLCQIEEDHGTVGAWFADWQVADYCDNLRIVQKGGSRLGGKTGQMFLRRMGVDTLVFSNDVIKALGREGVVSKMPSSGKDFAAVQDAINQWHGETGRPLTQISQILALSVG